MIRPNVSDILLRPLLHSVLSFKHPVCARSARKSFTTMCVCICAPRGEWAMSLLTVRFNGGKKTYADQRQEPRAEKPTKPSREGRWHFQLQSGVKRCCPKAIFTFGFSVFVCDFPLPTDGHWYEQRRPEETRGSEVGLLSSILQQCDTISAFGWFRWKPGGQ